MQYLVRFPLHLMNRFSHRNICSGKLYNIHVQFTSAADVSMGEPVHQMEREPYEVLHDFFVIFCFLHEVLDIYIYILIHF